jgi:hypothetical protein
MPAMTIDTGKLPPPPGLISSLMRGFDSVANHILVILPPVVFDLFFWFGPRLRVTRFLQPVIDSLPAVGTPIPNGLPDMATIQKMWTDFASQFNLFVLLRTFPVGTMSLLSFQSPGKNPLGIPIDVDAGSFFGVVAWILLLAILGWSFGSLYYYWVSRVAVTPEKSTLSKYVLQTMLLSAIWVGILLVFGIPAMTLITIVTVYSSFLGQILFFILTLLLFWLVMPIFFSPHGIFTLQMDAFRAILNSLRMVRFTLPNTGLFLLVILIINLGLNFLWNTPPQTSWWMLVGIAGHAFVSTGLLAASFIYYRDIDVWLKAVLEMLQRQQASPKI